MPLSLALNVVFVFFLHQKMKKKIQSKRRNLYVMNLTVLYYRDHATEFLEALGQYREALKVTNYIFLYCF